jgi:hypothetical protein
MNGNTTAYGYNLTELQMSMLDSLADDDYREEVRGRFVAGNAPHPFQRVRMLSPRQRLCGLPEAARARALANVQGLDRYSGIVASHILGGSHNFASGGFVFNAYADGFGEHRGQLGVLAERTGGYRVTTGRWEKVHPVGVHHRDEWMFVWVDGMFTRLSGPGMAKPAGLGLDVALVPVVFRVEVRAVGELIASGTHQCLPYAAPEAAEAVRVAFLAEGCPNPVVTFHAA